MGSVHFFGDLYPIDCPSLNIDMRWQRGTLRPVDMSDFGNSRGVPLSHYTTRRNGDVDATIGRYTVANPHTHRVEHFHITFRCERIAGDATAIGQSLKTWLEVHMSQKDIKAMFLPLVNIITKTQCCRKFWKGNFP